MTRQRKQDGPLDPTVFPDEDQAPTRAPCCPPALLRWAFGRGQIPGGAQVGSRWRARPRALFLLQMPFCLLIPA